MVCKTEDTELGPFVALKFLPDDVAHDSQALLAEAIGRLEGRDGHSLEHSEDGEDEDDENTPPTRN